MGLIDADKLIEKLRDFKEWEEWLRSEAEQENNMSGIDLIVYGMLLTFTMIGTTEFVIGLLLLREYDKLQKEKDKQHGMVRTLQMVQELEQKKLPQYD